MTNATASTYPKTATYRVGAMARFTAPAMACILLIGPVAFWPLAFDGNASVVGTTLYLAVASALVVLAAYAIRFGRNARFVLTPQAIASWRFGAGTELPLARIESLTATRQSKSATTKVVLNAMGGARSLTIYPEDRHLLDDDLFAWLAALPRRGGDAIRRPKPPTKSSGLSWVFSIVLCGLSLFLVAGMIGFAINDARTVISGYPPLQSLSQTTGSATWIGPCHPGGKGYSAYLPIRLETATGRVRESVDCDLSTALNAPPAPHRVSIWRDRRRFSDGGAREVDIDGRPARSYADYIARDRRYAPFFLVSHLMILTAIALLACGLVASSREGPV